MPMPKKPRFESGAFREEKKKPGAISRFSEFELLTRLAEKDNQGNLRLTYYGRTRLKELRAPRIAKEKLVARMKRHGFAKQLFERPISFKTKDGKKIRMLRHGFENVYLGHSKTKRAMVIVFVDGRKLFFYQSSGKNSKLPGEWFPTLGMEVYDYSHEGDKRTFVGSLTKMQGHSNDGTPSFPDWINEIRARIKASEKQFVLHSDWGPKKFVEIRGDILEKIPSTNEIEPSRY